MQSRLSDKSRANYIDGTKLTRLIEDYLQNELRFEQARAVARTLVEHLRTRNFILCDLGANSYAFVHRTFLEYFCAADIVHQFNVAKTLEERDLIALFEAHSRDDDWREVLRLICGQIDEVFVGRIVKHLTTSAESVMGYDELILCFQCLSEGRNRVRLCESEHSLLEIIFRLAEQSTSEPYWEGFRNAMQFQGNRFWFFTYVGVEIASALDVPKSALGVQFAMDFAVFGNEMSKESLNALYPTLIDDLTGKGASDPFKRVGAIHGLTKHWPDETTRELLTQRAVQDDNVSPRSAAIHALAEKWPDETTRELLTGWVIDAPHSDVRRAAIRVLTEEWPDETTRNLIARRAVEDDNESPRSAAIQALAEGWPDETTRNLIARRAVEDDNESPRSAAIRALAEEWPDETTRNLIARRAVEDDNESPRSAAIRVLAEEWPDETTRELLTRWAVQDDNESPRSAAIHALAEKWPDETTRELLTRWAVQDDNESPRSAAIQALAERWPDETTRNLIARRAVEDPDASTRGVASSLLGRMHSIFGHILTTVDLDGIAPYFDPLEPIPREHIEKAAKEVGICPEDIDDQVAALSAHCGWDITVGAPNLK